MYLKVKSSSSNKEHHIRCHRCTGTGRAACQICSGSGKVITGRDVFGKTIYDRCGGCFGNKSSRCAFCGGTGFT